MSLNQKVNLSVSVADLYKPVWILGGKYATTVRKVGDLPVSQFAVATAA